MSFPSLPNRYPVLLMLLLLAMIYYGEQYFKDYFKYRDEMYEKAISDNEKRPELMLDSIKFKFEKKNLAKETASNISDSLELLKSIATTNYNSTVDKLKSIRENLESSEKSAGDAFDMNKRVLLVFGICFFLMFTLVHNQLSKEDNFLRVQAESDFFKNRIYKNCQSCGKFFTPLLLHGKNQDGTNSDGFCSDCFENGQFKNPNLTKEEVIEEMLKSNPKKKKVVKFVSKLVRWNKNPYVDNYTFE